MDVGQNEINDGDCEDGARNCDRVEQGGRNLKVIELRLRQYQAWLDNNLEQTTTGPTDQEMRQPRFKDKSHRFEKKLTQK